MGLETDDLKGKGILIGIGVLWHHWSSGAGMDHSSAYVRFSC